MWNARLLDDSLHKALYGRGKALYQSTHHYKDFGPLGEFRGLDDGGPPMGTAVWLRRFGQLLDDGLHLSRVQYVAGAGR